MSALASAKIESLSRHGQRLDSLSATQRTSYIDAVRDLVRTTQGQLMTHQIDRDAASDSPKDQHRYDAYFFVPEIEGVISLTSVGLPDAPESHGLFIDIDYRNEKGQVKKLTALQTAKAPEVVGETEALWLSGYTPKQLLEIAELVRTANPITPEAYKAYFDQPKISEDITM